MSLSQVNHQRNISSWLTEEGQKLDDCEVQNSSWEIQQKNVQTIRKNFTTASLSYLDSLAAWISNKKDR